jgi:hypothetical protein
MAVASCTAQRWLNPAVFCICQTSYCAAFIFSEFRVFLWTERHTFQVTIPGIKLLVFLNCGAIHFWRRTRMFRRKQCRRERVRSPVKLKRKKSKRIPFIFNDESTGSCICLRLDLYMSHVNKVQPIRITTIRVEVEACRCISNLRFKSVLFVAFCILSLVTQCAFNMIL